MRSRCSSDVPDTRKNPSSFYLQNSTLEPVTHNSDCQREKNEGPHQQEALKCLKNQTLTNAELRGSQKAVTGQPQPRSPLLHLGLGDSTDHSPLLHKSINPVSNLHNTNRGTGNGILSSNLISTSNSQKPHRKLQPHSSINSQSSKKSKSSSSQSPSEVQQDCCVHCILACLFCEFLALGNIILDCTTCGSGTSDESSCCCCCCGSGECADGDLPCDLDCGIVDACCESADCLEICMECCGLCFSS
ncbi:myoD family inhibitor [Rhinatrema bivittatum]|uniref:myoD family inhibitor n=1 Tax=Rhinatrema bivittatum TaxID=194408 RepID=UPI0011278670|nr:myoD family inhibitor [Rhinatrema bivittatum]